LQLVAFFPGESYISMLLYLGGFGMMTALQVVCGEAVRDLIKGFTKVQIYTVNFLSHIIRLSPFLKEVQ
jgi:hypothetical protein